MSALVELAVAVLVGSAAGGYTGHVVAAAPWRGRRSTTVELDPFLERGNTPPHEEQRLRQAVAAQRERHRVASLAGLDLLRDLTVLLETVARDHKHYSDSDGHCPLGLAADLVTRLDARSQDYSRYLASIGAVPDTMVSVSEVEAALTGVRRPAFTPPVSHKGAGRDPDLLCAYRHAAMSAIVACQTAIDDLRRTLYDDIGTDAG